ncbi:MAG: glycoside hydrolase family 127 protein [Gemmatimonadaceae bacterium]
MGSTRRDFLQRSAKAAAAASLAPLARGAAEVEATVGEGAKARGPLKEQMVRARPVALSKVRVTDGPLKVAQDNDAKYLLALEPDRMLAYYRTRAGLPQKAQPYGGWDGGGRNLTGHIAGHYLSAVSLMYLATGDSRFRDRANIVVAGLKEVQDKNGDGYLSALEGGREAWAAVSKGDIRSGGFDLNGLWSPWYTLHKTFAGLRDAYRHTGNSNALDVEVKFAAWAEGVLAPLTEVQIQKMLNTEHGGMNEVLADLYADTGDKRWLDLSYRFEHRAFTDALKRGQDNLNGKHGNCQIPKLIGSAERYAYTGDTGDVLAANFFWDRVVEHHSYATGGHGLAEYFGAPDQLSARVDGRTCESCNDYNMLKLTRRLFSFRPDAYYADFHERALFNHVLASMDPEDGRTSYMVPVGRGVQQEYQNMQQSFTCCVGTGMESHALHGYGVYYESDDTLWVNLFMPSTATFTTAGVDLTMETGFPDGDTAKMTLAMPKPSTFTLAVRRPSWAGDGFTVKVNGLAVEQPTLANLKAGGAGGRNLGEDDRVLQPSSYVELKRAWKSGDVVELTLPKSLRLEPTPDNKSVTAIMWGPLVLAGDHGPRQERRGEGVSIPVPVLVAADKPVTDWVIPAETGAGNYKAAGVARSPSQPAIAGDVSLAPFYRTQRRMYSVYFDVLAPSEFDKRAASIAAERERVRRMEAATTGFAQPGEMQPERDYNYQSEPADRPVNRTNGRANRGGAGWFSFDIPVDPNADMAVVVTYLNELGLPPASGNFQILLDGMAVAKFEPNLNAVGFFDQQYVVPAALSRGKSKVTVKFQAAANSRIVPVFGVRMIRAKDA